MILLKRLRAILQIEYFVQGITDIKDIKGIMPQL